MLSCVSPRASCGASWPAPAISGSGWSSIARLRTPTIDYSSGRRFELEKMIGAHQRSSRNRSTYDRFKNCGETQKLSERLVSTGTSISREVDGLCAIMSYYFELLILKTAIGSRGGGAMNSGPTGFLIVSRRILSTSA
jgi:hypothetical protein